MTKINVPINLKTNPVLMKKLGIDDDTTKVRMIGIAEQSGRPMEKVVKHKINSVETYRYSVATWSIQWSLKPEYTDSVYVLEHFHLYEMDDTRVSAIEYYLIGDIISAIGVDEKTILLDLDNITIDNELTEDRGVYLSIQSFPSVDYSLLSSLCLSEDVSFLDTLSISIQSKDHDYEAYLHGCNMAALLLSNRPDYKMIMVNYDCIDEGSFITINRLDSNQNIIATMTINDLDSFIPLVEESIVYKTQGKLKPPRKYIAIYKHISDEITNRTSSIMFKSDDIVGTIWAIHTATDNYGVSIHNNEHNKMISLAQEIVATGREIEYLVSNDLTVPIKSEIMTPILLDYVLSVIASKEIDNTETSIYSLLRPVPSGDIIVVFTSVPDYDISVIDYLKDELELTNLNNSKYDYIINRELSGDRVGVILTVVNEE